MCPNTLSIHFIIRHFNVDLTLGLLAGTPKPLILIKQKGSEVSTDLIGMENLEYNDTKELHQLLKEYLTNVTTKARTYPKIAGYATSVLR